MSLRELQVKTLQGRVFTLDVRRIKTVKQLKWRLREYFCSNDPIERKILKVEVLHDSWFLDDALTLKAELHAESNVTVVYTRTEIEAATKNDIYKQDVCQVNIPQAVTNVPREAFSHCRSGEGYHSRFSH